MKKHLYVLLSALLALAFAAVSFAANNENSTPPPNESFAPALLAAVTPTITVGEWDENDNSVTVHFSAPNATYVSVYASTGRMVTSFSGTSGSWTFRQSDGGYFHNGNYYLTQNTSTGWDSTQYPFVIDCLDDVSPVIQSATVSPDSPWAASRTITVTATDQTNVIYSLRDTEGNAVPGYADVTGVKTGDSFTGTFTLTAAASEAKTYKVYATDRWNNWRSETTVDVGAIDPAKPDAPVITYDKDNPVNSWHNTDITATITGGPVTPSGYTLEYRMDSGAWTAYTGPITVTDEGHHILQARAVGGNGLISEVAEGVIAIDKTPPQGNWELMTTTPTLGPVYIHISTDYDESGVKEIICPDGSKGNPWGISYPVTSNGQYDFIVIDNAGNHTTLTASVTNIAVLDVTTTLSTSFVINPNKDTVTGGQITIKNESMLPVVITMQSIAPVGGAPSLVGPSDRDWKLLSVADTHRYMALGLTSGNSIPINLWETGAPQSIGTLDKNLSLNLYLQARYGYAWQETTAMQYQVVLKYTLTMPPT